MQTTHETTESVLDVQSISHRYGLVEALSGVSFELHRGELLAVIGPNGSGKSTLLRDIAGIQEPTEGQITYRGPESSRPIGYLPQRPAFRPGQRVDDALRFFTDIAGVDRSVVDEVLDQVGLTAARERKVETLSGGMTRLLAIAQAMIGQPPVIVLDEPASGLDPQMRMHIFETLQEITASGTGILVSSHDLALIEETAETVLLLEGGDPVASGSVAAIREQAGESTLHGAFRTLLEAEPGVVTVTEGY